VRAHERRRAATPRVGGRSRKKREPAFLHLMTTGRRTGIPREIEIWFTRNGDRYYLVAETGERAQWVMNLRHDPRVRWRVGRTAFDGRARVVDPVRQRPLAAAVRAWSTAKYGWGEGLIVELRPRRTRRARS
jgi:deazaflavin-dependent oxidoreductase (nitroreductase family)